MLCCAASATLCLAFRAILRRLEEENAQFGATYEQEAQHLAQVGRDVAFLAGCSKCNTDVAFLRGPASALLLRTSMRAAWGLHVERPPPPNHPQTPPPPPLPLPLLQVAARVQELEAHVEKLEVSQAKLRHEVEEGAAQLAGLEQMALTVGGWVVGRWMGSK